uniref:Uncharacterized protein n=1 Tax=Anguilla anguilla TaxID=7936 RepID=A0A0E9QC29_ANGAN
MFWYYILGGKAVKVKGRWVSLVN